MVTVPSKHHFQVGDALYYKELTLGIGRRRCATQLIIGSRRYCQENVTLSIGCAMQLSIGSRRYCQENATLSIGTRRTSESDVGRKRRWLRVTA